MEYPARLYKGKQPEDNDTIWTAYYYYYYYYYYYDDDDDDDNTTIMFSTYTSYAHQANKHVLYFI